MTLKELLAEGRLEPRPTSKDEIQSLLKVAERSMNDALVEQLSSDGRFNFAYDAALQLATVTLRCAGYRTKGEGHHATVFEALPEVMGSDVRARAGYLQKCRKIRNLSTYSRSGMVSLGEVKELIMQCQEFSDSVHAWIKEKYPKYL
jgi:hypothetical protein